MFPRRERKGKRGVRLAETAPRGGGKKPTKESMSSPSKRPACSRTARREKKLLRGGGGGEGEGSNLPPSHSQRKREKKGNNRRRKGKDFSLPLIEKGGPCLSEEKKEGMHRGLLKENPGGNGSNGP